MTACVISTTIGSQPTGVIIFSMVPSTVGEQTPFSIIGNVTPNANAPNVLCALSTSRTTPPGSGWLAVEFSDDAGDFLTAFPAGAPTAATYYVWAKDPGTTAVAVSDAITVTAVTNALALDDPTDQNVILTGDTHFYMTLDVTGTVAPPIHGAEFALGATDTTAPTSGWQTMTNDGAGNLSLTGYAPSGFATGAYYFWMKDTTTNLLFVSAGPLVYLAPYAWDITFPASKTYNNHAPDFTNTNTFIPPSCTCTIAPAWGDFASTSPLFQMGLSDTTVPSPGAGQIPMVLSSTNSDGSRVFVEKAATGSPPTGSGITVPTVTLGTTIAIPYFSWIGLTGGGVNPDIVNDPADFCSPTANQGIVNHV